jgi:hypothetical protein
VAGYESQSEQASYLNTLWLDIAQELSANDQSKVCLGGTVFEWNDEWWKTGGVGVHEPDGYETTWNVIAHPDGFANEEWFGIVSNNRERRQAFYTLQNLWLGTIDIGVRLQGEARPETGWVIPLTIKFFTSGNTPPADVLSETPVYTFNLTTNKNGGTAMAQVSGVTPGTYDISVASPHCLINVKRGVVITTLSTNVDMGTLLEGNANDDNQINIRDFGLLASTYGKNSGAAGFDARADFDDNSVINISDFGLLAANYGKHNPIAIP